MEIVKAFTKPANDWTKDDWTAFHNFMVEMAGEGKTVVLGHTRCFFCGIELGETVKVGPVLNPGHRVGIILNTCDGCGKQVAEKGGNHATDESL